NAADNAHAEPDQPELVDHDAERAQQKAAAPTQSSDKASLAGPSPFEPTAEHRRRQTKYDNAEGEDPKQIADAPVASCREKGADQREIRADGGLVAPNGARQWEPEHAEPVGHADAKMNRQSRGRYEPTIEAWL